MCVSRLPAACGDHPFKAVKVGAGKPGFVQSPAPVTQDCLPQRRGPPVFDQCDSGGAARWYGIGERPSRRFSFWLGRGYVLLPSPAEHAGSEPSKMGRYLVVSHRLEGAVLGSRDQEQVDESNDPSFLQPGELGDHLPREARLIEPDDDHLHRSDHRATLACNWSYSA